MNPSPPKKAKAGLTLLHLWVFAALLIVAVFAAVTPRLFTFTAGFLLAFAAVLFVYLFGLCCDMCPLTTEEKYRDLVDQTAWGTIAPIFLWVVCTWLFAAFLHSGRQSLILYYVFFFVTGFCVGVFMTTVGLSIIAFRDLSQIAGSEGKRITITGWITEVEKPSPPEPTQQ